MSEQGKVGEAYIDVRLRVSDAEIAALERRIGDVGARAGAGRAGGGGVRRTADGWTIHDLRPRIERENAEIRARQDVNEARYQRNFDAAQFASHRATEREAAKPWFKKDKWYNREVGSTGMLMSAMFGGWEVATAMRAGGEVSRLAGRGARLSDLDSMLQNVEQITKGPLGSLVALPGDAAESLSQATGWFSYQTKSTDLRNRVEAAHASSEQTRGAAERADLKTLAPHMRDLNDRAYEAATAEGYGARMMKANLTYRRAMVEESAAAAGLNTAYANARADGDTLGAVKAMNDVKRFNIESPIRIEAARVELEAERVNTGKEADRALGVIDRRSGEINAAQELEFGTAARLRVRRQLEDEIAAAPPELRVALRQQRDDILVAEKAMGIEDARTLRVGAGGMRLRDSGLGLAGDLVMNDLERRRAMQDARPEARDETGAYFDHTAESIKRRSKRRTSGMAAEGNALRAVLAGKPNDAQAIGIVAETLNGLPDLDSPQQQRLAIESAKLRLDILQKGQAQLVSPGSPNPFVAPAGNGFEAGPFKKQLDEGANVAQQEMAAALKTLTNLGQRIADIIANAFQN